MRGVGGPLLTIGDLLSDLAVDGGDDPLAAGGDASVPSSPSAAQQAGEADPSDLSRLFEEHYNNLMKALQENDPSWPSLMLKLCAALKASDKLVSSANTNAEQLVEKVKKLEGVLERGERAVEEIVESLQKSGLAKDPRSSRSKTASKSNLEKTTPKSGVLTTLLSLKQNHNTKTYKDWTEQIGSPLGLSPSRRRSRRRPPRGDGPQQPPGGVAGRGPGRRRRRFRGRVVVLGRRRRLQRRRRSLHPLPPRVLRLVRGAHVQQRQPGGHRRRLLLALRRLRVEGETLAFHFICGIFCLVGWGSRVFGSRRTYRDRTICMDWHCRCPTVCLCVSQWADLLDMPL